MVVAIRKMRFSKLPARAAAAPRFLAFLAIFSLLVIGPTYAQNSNTGEIRGTVTDTSSAVIPGVAITVQNTLTGVITNLVSDSTGIYDAPLLPPGT